MSVGDMYPQEFFDMSAGIPVKDETIKEWLNLLDKSEASAIRSGDTIVVKTENGDFIVAKNYKILDSEMVEQYKRQKKELVDEAETFIKNKRFEEGEN